METEGEIIRVLWVHGKVVITHCQEKSWYNNALVSNWGRNWISALRLLLHTHPQKFKLKWIKESNVQNKVLTPLEKYKWKYIYASGFPKAANGYSMWWLIQQSKLKAVRLLSSSLLSAVTELSRIWSFDLRCEAVFCFVLFCFYLIAIFWWRNVMTWRAAAPRRQQDRWGSGLGIRPWTLF